MKTDLFGADSEELFCPLDGLILIHSKWEWCGDRLLTCAKGHVWDARWSRMWQNQLEFDVIVMVNCPDCGQLCPRQLMEHSEFGQQPQSSSRRKAVKKVCPDCFEKIKQAWRPDLERSHGRLTISPIKRGDKVIFPYEEEVVIEPYPNPYHAGGCWGGGTMTSEAEVEERIKNFTDGIADYPFTADYYGLWKRLGVKFEVIRKPVMTAAEYLNERDREYVEEHPEEADSPDYTQMRLIA